MNIYSMLDEKSKESIKRMAVSEKKKQLKNEAREKHFEEFHFKSGDELLKHIRGGKRAYRGDDYGWISIDKKDKNMVVSFERNEQTGQMELKYEKYETFKGYTKLLDNMKENGYISFWHKKPSHK